MLGQPYYLDYNRESREQTLAVSQNCHHFYLQLKNPAV